LLWALKITPNTIQIVLGVVCTLFFEVLFLEVHVTPSGIGCNCTMVHTTRSIVTAAEIVEFEFHFHTSPRGRFSNQQWDVNNTHKDLGAELELCQRSRAQRWQARRLTTLVPTHHNSKTAVLRWSTHSGRRACLHRCSLGHTCCLGARHHCTRLDAFVGVQHPRVLLSDSECDGVLAAWPQ